MLKIFICSFTKQNSKEVLQMRTDEILKLIAYKLDVDIKQLTPEANLIKDLKAEVFTVAELLLTLEDEIAEFDADKVSIDTIEITIKDILDAIRI